MSWDLSAVEVGDYIKVQIVNKKGDRNLDGGTLAGTIVEINSTYQQAQLDTGWCVHTKDTLLEHKPRSLTQAERVADGELEPGDAERLAGQAEEHSDLEEDR